MSTGTLNLSRIAEERRRQEADQAKQASSDLTVETDDLDAAGRARRIVEEVLAAADTSNKDEDPAGDEDVTAVLDPEDATGIAQRIVEEALEEERAREAEAERAAQERATKAAAAKQAEPEADEAVPAEDVDALKEAADATARADLVLLGLDEPVVLLPGEAYEPTEEPWIPDNGEAKLAELTDRAFGIVARDDDDEKPTTLVAALRGAAVTPQMPGARWLIVGILWALAAAALVPFMIAAVGNAVDLEIDLWGPERTAVTRNQ